MTSKRKQATFLYATVPMLAALSLFGCNDSSTQTSVSSGQGTLVTYQCKDGATFTARLSDQEAIADLPDKPNLALPRVESGSGAKYSDGTTTLWDKDGEAFVETNGEMLLIDCQATESTETAQPDASATQSSQAASSNTNAQPSTAAASNSGSGIQTQRIQFQPGTTSSVVEDSITGYEIVDYILGAQVGQYMNVSMATDNRANYFNILPPGSNDEAIFTGSTNGNQYEGTLPTSGDYKIRVYMMRSAARRDEVANYRLEMIVSGQEASAGGSTGGSNVEGDALVPGTNYNATGSLSCAMSQAEADGKCPFGVVREGNGSGFIEVTTQYGETFSIYFQDGEAVGAEGGSGAFSSDQQGDTTYVYIGEERYVIPDAVIFGG